MRIIIYLIMILFTCFIGFADDPDEINPDEINPDEMFIEAAQLGNMEDILKYHELGADINSKDIFSWNALMWACQEGHIYIVKYLIDNGSDVNYMEEFNGWTALIAASFKGHIEAVILLLDAGADVNPDVSGFDSTSTPLKYARRFRHTDIVNLLIDAGAE